ncbi:P-loop containing nucleoside triphosphate hydrolase protein, partial [Lineolata rhizophorae]
MDSGFSPLTGGIVDRAMPSLRVVVFCSATVPKWLEKRIAARFGRDKLIKLASPGLHAVPRRVQLGAVDTEQEPYRGRKDVACADVVWKIGKAATEAEEDVDAGRNRTKRIVVFVNERESAVKVAAFLRSKGVDAVAWTRDARTGDEAAQGKDGSGAAVLEGFVGWAAGDSKHEDESKQLVHKSGARVRLPGVKVLVTTDLGSRGIDTTAVRHVILYDVPQSTVDFIHRLGRTGRMGRRGRGIVLLGKGDRKDVVREVREAMFRGRAL